MIGRWSRPVRRRGDGFVVVLHPNQRAGLRNLLAELRQLVDADPADQHTAALIERLFPAAYTNDDERESEYQRLMRSELAESRRSALTIVDAALAADSTRLDASGLMALMQSINSIRLVLGTVLEVSDDPDVEVDPAQLDSPMYAWYGFLSWLLEHCVSALGGGTDS